MYAVIQTGGKQYGGAAGDTIRIDRLGGKVVTRVDWVNVMGIPGERQVFVGAEVEKATRTGDAWGVSSASSQQNKASPQTKRTDIRKSDFRLQLQELLRFGGDAPFEDAEHPDHASVRGKRVPLNPLMLSFSREAG